MKTCVFIVSLLSQPRCIKRIETVSKAGIPIKVYGFDKGLYSVNSANLPFAVEKVYSNKVGNRIQKIVFHLKVVRHIVKRHRNDIILRIRF